MRSSQIGKDIAVVILLALSLGALFSGLDHSAAAAHPQVAKWIVERQEVQFASHYVFALKAVANG